MKNFLTPGIEKTVKSNQFFNGSPINTNSNIVNLSNSPIIKENIINNILDSNRLAGKYSTNCNSPNILTQKNQRQSYSEKYMSNENCKKDINNYNMNKGYNVCPSPNNYKESKDFKQQMQEMGLLKSKNHYNNQEIETNNSSSQQPRTNTFQSVMNTLNKKEEITTIVDNKPFFQNMILHTNPNLVNSQYNASKMNSTTYGNSKKKPTSKNESNRIGSKGKGTTNNNNKSCMNSADTSKFKNGYIANGLHSSLYSKENNNLVLNQSDNPHMSNVNNPYNPPIHKPMTPMQFPTPSS